MLVAASSFSHACAEEANEVVAASRQYADGGGYHWTAGNSGTPVALVHKGETILPKGESSICCGLTLAVAFEVANERGLFEEKTPEQLKAFQKAWYGDGPNSRETLCVHAVEQLGIGRAIPLDEAQAGDFVQFWRSGGSGHSVIFLQWVADGDERVGFRYRSSQKSTDGIGDRTEYFADAQGHKGSVLRERTYACRLDEAISNSDYAIPDGIQLLIAEGKFTAAEEKLRAAIDDPDAPVVDGPAAAIEKLHRIRHDFALTTPEVLNQIQQSVPDATLDDLVRWRDAGELQFRVIDGDIRYYRRAVSNLFRFLPDAQARMKSRPQRPAFDQTAHIADLVKIADETGQMDVHPIKFTFHHELVIKPGHPRLKPGAKVRAWLPYPQEYTTQRDVRLLKSEPAPISIAGPEVPHRTIYFEQTIDAAGTPPRFAVEFEFVNSARVLDLDPAKVTPYDTSSPRYQEYTAERLPHIALTPEVRALAQEIVGDEENPLTKARLLFRWVSTNIPWCAEVEYGIIDSLSAKGLAARRGDCGVQGMTFITLCRAAGIPARWQSGFQLKPGAENLHDWAEIYIAPWGWLPADPSHGVRDHGNPKVRDFLCGQLDPYRLVVNTDFARPLTPPKTSLRSEPNDFQRGEVEIDGHNLYFGEWTYEFDVESKRLER